MVNIFNKAPSERDKSRAENYFWKGMERLNNDKRNQAVQEFENALEFDAGTILPLMEEQFDTLYHDARNLEALTIATACRRHKKEDYKFLNRLGNVYRKLGEFKKANECYKRALAVNRQFNLSFFNLAASMGKVPHYDDDLPKLIKTYVSLDAYLFPKSIYPRDKRILDHLTETLNMKAFFGKVERLQELILKKTLMEEEPDLEKMDIMVDRIKQKLYQKIEQDRTQPDIPKLLKEALDQDWSKLSSGGKDQFLWDVLNLGLYIFKENSAIRENRQERQINTIVKTDLQLAIDCFVKLKLEQYSYKYLDMIVGLRHTLEGDLKQSISELKTVLKEDPNNRYVNINLGLLYHQEGNRLLSVVHLLKGANAIEELGGVCHLVDILDKARQYNREGAQKRALKLYKAASVETDSVEILEKIGEILMSLHRFYDAIQPYKEILRIDPESEHANAKLTEIQDHFCFLADEFFNVREFIKASEHYEKALEIGRPSRILYKAMKACKMQGDHKQEFALQEEYQQTLAREKAKDKQDLRQKHVTTGMRFMKLENYQRAIESFSEAFRIQVDKEVFMYLSYLYKKLNQKRALQELMVQWNAMMKEDD